MFKNTKHSPIFLASALTVAVVILSITLTFLFKKDTRKVEILVAPTTASITINGKAYENGSHDLPAGEVSVHIEKPGFITKDYTFNTTQNDKLYAYLLQEDGSLSWYESHQDDDIIMTAIGDYYADQAAKGYISKNPAISNLPIIYASYDEEYNYTEFRIDGGNFEECSSEFCLKITDTTGDSLELAKKLLLEKGINPQDYEIIYEHIPITPLD